MKKKRIMLISILLLVGSMVFLYNLSENSFVVFNSVSDEEALKIQEARKKEERLSFSCLLCNDTRMPYDDAEKTFYVPLDMEDADWETMEFASGQPEYRILFERDITRSDKKDAIAEGKKFEFLVYDDARYATYYVTFSGLPLMDFSTSEGFYSENITGTAMFYGTDFSVNGPKTSEYNAHLRGNTSRMYPKKGYRLNLTKSYADGTTGNHKMSLFGMREDDDWILYAMYNDNTKLRDALSIELWNLFGAKAVSEKSIYGTGLTYVEVFADNVYRGLYGLMEPVDAKQLDLGTEDFSYKRKNPGGLQNKYDEFMMSADPEALLSGFELDEGPVSERPWEQLALLSELLTKSKEELQTMEETVVNEDSAMRMWLFIQMITGHDQTAKNMFYVAKKTDAGYRFFFAPWDMDLTWGNVSVGEANPLYTDFEMETYDDRVYWETGDWLIDLNYHGVREQMQALYRELRSTVLTDEALEEMILQLDGRIRDSGAYERDWQRWGEGAHTESCSQLIVYAKRRLNFLDQALFDFELFDD